MKWYQTLRCDNTVTNPFVADSEDLKGINEWDLVSGKRLKNWDSTVLFQAKERKNDGEPDDVLQNGLGLPIYSSRLRKAMEDAGIRGIQYLPVDVARPNGSRISGFAIANILNLLPALDMSRSDYELFGRDRPDRKGEILILARPVLRASCLPGYHIIRLKEFKLSIFVSEDIKIVFDLGEFTGWSFDEVALS